jgi:hypothetical protein
MNSNDNRPVAHSGGRLNERVSLVSALVVAVGAIWGSASALLRIATDAGMSVPWSLPVGLDAVGIVAATAIRRHRTDRLAWGTLVAATGISTVLQVLAAPDGLVNHLAHAVPPVAVLVSFELFQRATDHRTDQPVTVEAVEADPAPVEGHAVEQAERVSSVSPKRPATRRRTTKARRSVTVPAAELVVVARQVAEDLDGRGVALSRRTLVDGMRAAGYPVGNARAGQILTELRTPDPTPTAAVAPVEQASELVGVAS